MSDLLCHLRNFPKGQRIADSTGWNSTINGQWAARWILIKNMLPMLSEQSEACRFIPVLNKDHTRGDIHYVDNQVNLAREFLTRIIG